MSVVRWFVSSRRESHGSGCRSDHWCRVWDPGNVKADNPAQLFGVGALAHRGLPPLIGGLCGDHSPHRTTMTQTKRCPIFQFGLWWWCVKKVMNKTIVRDLGHFDNAIELACLDCLEGMLQVWPLKPSWLRSTSCYRGRG